MVMGRGESMIFYGIAVHGGVGTSRQLDDGCRAACDEAVKILDADGDALDAVAEAVRVLEDDGRFNAGDGSILRLDGITREMDAGLMDSVGRVGAVIALREVRNPILVARAVIETPHVILCGEGATLFAVKRGFARLGSVPDAVFNRHLRTASLIDTGTLGDEYPRWKGHDIDSLCNFPAPPREEALPRDTVGAVAIDRKGVFAAAGSTGGAIPMLLGRVGDTPLVGCGFYAGAAGAVVTTGLGEEILKRMLAKTVYDGILSGLTAEKACDMGVALFAPEIPVGLLAVTGTSFGLSANREMAGHSITRGI
jgi:beta-aspartyl-peptidase (threonine type)